MEPEDELPAVEAEEEEIEEEEEEPAPKPKARVRAPRPSRAKAKVAPVEVKRPGRPKKEPGAPKARYNRKKPVEVQMPQPQVQPVQPVPMAPHEIASTTTYMAHQLGSLQRSQFESKRETWRDLIRFIV